MFPLNFIEEKISLDGKKVIAVPVSLELPISFKGFFALPCENSIKYFFPFICIYNSNFSDRELTTDTPTPCKPPDTLYES